MLNRLSIRRALLLSFAIILIAILALTVYVSVVLNGVGQQFGSVVDKNVNLLSTISDLRYYTVTYRRFALDYGLTTSAEEHRKILEVIEHNRQEVERALGRMQRLAQGGAVGRFVDDYRRKIHAYERMQEHYIDLIDNGRMAAARTEMLGPMLAPFNEIVDLLTEIQQLLVADAEAIRAQEARGMDRLLTSIVAICLVLTGLTLAAGILISRKVGRPLQLLIAQMSRVERGDLSQRLDMSQFARDELGAAATHFTHMQDGIRALVGEITSSVGRLTDAIESVHSLSEKASQRLQAQQAHVSDNAAAMNQMLASLEDVARSTAGAADAAKRASEEATTGTRVVRQSIQQIEGVADQLEAADEVIQSLRADSASIGVLSDVIREVAERTNLLALNAAIEAARAGDHGRGFAVVAAEVRTLAQRTQQSVAEINDTIGVLQERTEQAGSVMQQSQSAMRESVGHAREAGSSIAHISEAIGRISETNTQVAAATEQQTLVAGEVNEGSSNIRRAADEVADGAEQTVAACIELGALANRLRELSARFQV